MRKRYEHIAKRKVLADIHIFEIPLGHPSTRIIFVWQRHVHLAHCADVRPDKQRHPQDGVPLLRPTFLISNATLNKGVSVEPSTQINPQVADEPHPPPRCRDCHTRVRNGENLPLDGDWKEIPIPNQPPRHRMSEQQSRLNTQSTRKIRIKIRVHTPAKSETHQTPTPQTSRCLCCKRRLTQ
jgi:hypothetical protein